MTTDCRVSVLMAAYNAQAHLAESVRTIREQTHDNLQIVIVNDGSTDDTASILDTFEKSDDRIVVLHNEQNMRLAASLNKGLDYCTGKYVARADAGEIYRADRIERQVAFMDSHPETGIVASSYYRIDEDGNRLGYSEPPAHDCMIRTTLLWDSAICHPGAMVRAETLSEARYHPDYWCSQDYDLWSRLAAVTTFANIQEPLLSVRIESGSTSGSRGVEGERLISTIVQRNLANMLGIEVSSEEALLFRLLMKGQRLDDPTLRAELSENWGDDEGSACPPGDESRQTAASSTAGGDCNAASSAPVKDRHDVGQDAFEVAVSVADRVLLRVGESMGSKAGRYFRTRLADALIGGAYQAFSNRSGQARSRAVKALRVDPTALARARNAKLLANVLFGRAR